MTVSVYEKARSYIVLDHPFFAAILLRHPMVADRNIPTLCVYPNGRIHYNDQWLETLTVSQAVFGFCHEVLHYASLHSFRRGKRDPRKWNIAGDAWINDTLRNLKIGEFIPGIVDMPGSAANTVENIYDGLPDDGGGSGGGSGSPGNSGDPMGDDLQDGAGDDQLTDSEKAEISAAVKQEVAEAAQAAKARGNLPGILQQFVSGLIDSKVPWFDVLERFMTQRVKQDPSWARPNRRYMPAFYLPVLQSMGSMGTVVLQVDISGSVSHKEIEHYNGHIKRIVEQCNPAKVVVLYTDTEVQKVEEFEQGEEVSINFYSGGGTDMCAGFEYCEKNGIEADVLVTLTDGYTPFPQDETIPSIWCISTAQKSPVGENVHFSINQ